MLFSSVSVLMPLVASAASSESYVEDAAQAKPSASAVVTDALQNDRTAEESFLYDEQKGYLDYYKNGDFGIYVNRYTGVLYYRNLKTGQILTSNPTDPYLADKTGMSAYNLLSQLSIRLFQNSNTSVEYIYNSAAEAAAKGQISVSAIKNGLRVNYAIGTTTNRHLLPKMLTVEKFDELFLKPFVDRLQRALRAEENAEALNSLTDVNYMYLSNEGAKNDADDSYNHLFVVKYIGSIMKLTRFSNTAKDPTIKKDINDMYALLGNYARVELKDSKGNPTGEYVYKLDENLTNAGKADAAKQLHNLCPTYSFDQMYVDERDAGYELKVESIPVLRCALEYTLNADGTLNASLPANSIVYDETFFTLDYITVLPYFGAGRMSTTENIPVDGYLFYPDGSGMILDFSDFYGQTFKMTNYIFGNDSAISALDESINRRGERITMPVYGIVNEQPATQLTKSITNKDTVTNGFLAIMQDGSSMATLSYEADASAHKYISAYATYDPYPSDTYDLSDTISVGSLGEYIIVSDSKYSGACTTCYVMLSDPDVQTVAAQQAQGYYPASYVGMAQCYRDYLKDKGVLSALENLTSDIPLYVESFGAMDVLDRFLTFPVTTSVPLTTFGDVETMYKEFSDKGVGNVIFRLTGFANGGMESTYPVKSRWEKACGGSRDFKELLALAKSLSVGNKSFALYPEFDFMYINNTATFDGISVKGNVSCMVDNRYASKQVYNSVLVDMEEKDAVNTLVITADAIPALFEKFLGKYGKYEIKNLSVSTMGTDLNSNFDKKNSMNREQAKAHVASVLETMGKKYSLMLDGGNEYALKNASHLLNIATDSSHYRYSSYTIPFVGMILHGYVSYAGTPLNYSGNADYDALRSIESGAAPYYILVYRNTEKLKENKELSRYYSVSYDMWKSSVVESYKYINTALKDLQYYEISDHKLLIAERVWDAEEAEKNLAAQEEIFFNIAKSSISEKIAEKIATKQPGQGLKVTIDRDMMLTLFANAVHKPKTDAKLQAVVDDIDAFCDKIEGNYDGKDANGNTDNFATLVIDSSNAFEVEFPFYFTDSEATDDSDYTYTNYTVDNGNVVMVTYTNGQTSVSYVLNYNSYAVTVRINGELITVNSYSYEPYEEV